MHRPFVSVVVPVYNQRAYLRQAVQSILDEHVEGCEVVVVDDASTDGGVDTIADLPVRVVRLPANVGGAGATSAGVEVAFGEYITFLDSDDLLAPNGLVWRVDWMRAHPEVPILGGRPAGIIDDQGRPLDRFEHVLRPGYEPPARLDWDLYARGGFYPVAHWLLMVHRDVFTEVGLFDRSFRIAYDCDFMFRVLQRYSIPLVFEPVVLRRVHGTNLSVVRDGGALTLTPSTIAECERILARYGLQAGSWQAWELGVSG